ncbi:MAG: hypothetical protein J1E31_07245 [Helicobacter sp.]|nr:hypothetical protein [Helicobacter sp.]
MESFKGFGNYLPFLPKIPSPLLTRFCVIGEDIPQATHYTFEKLNNNQRIQNLILLFPKTTQIPYLKAISKKGCRLYFWVKKADLNLKECEILSQYGIVFYENSLTEALF